jgi:heme oxygenase (biliverdin-IX-beta and delta-forming)
LTPANTQTNGLALSASQHSVRQILKQHTALMHQELDSSPALRALLKPALSLSDYCRTLSGYALAYETLEGDRGSLEMTLGLGKVPAYTPRLPALIHDLYELDQLTDIPRSVQALDRRHRRIRTEWQYWGSRYVLEGATQGSKFIALQLRKHLPQLLPRAFEFWEIQLRLAQEWPLVCDHLGQVCPKGDAKQQLLDGADIAFSTFSSCFASIEGYREN